MPDHVPHDIALFLIACLVGFAMALGTVSFSKPDRPVWPIRFYLLLFSMSRVASFRRYGASRKSFTWREQFLASWFIWSFIAFIVMVWFSGCPRHGC